MIPGHPIPAPLPDPNFYRLDLSLQQRLHRRLSPTALAWANPILDEVGRLAGGAVDRLAAVADRHRPELRVRDARGERIDAIAYHPAYVEMSRIAYEQLGLAAMAHVEGFRGFPGRVPQVIATAAQYLFAQAEQGLMCPIIMTDCLARALHRWGDAALRARWIPRLTAPRYEDLWEGAMFFTERAGGSDVGANETVAVEQEGQWRLYGDKWFCSNASAGAALVTARPEGAPPGIRGIGCFLMPARLEDGTRNHYRIERLKDKLGTWSMASGEVTLAGAVAYPVGPLDRGWHVAAEMVNATRLMVAMGCAGAMRRAFLAARHHAAGRRAFGQTIDSHPMLRQALVTLAVEVEAAQALMLEVADACDAAAAGSEPATALYRILTPLGKYWNADRGTPAVRQAMTILGGIGYTEEWVTARMFRDVQVNQIWEGAPNIICLDILRTAAKDGSVALLLTHLRERLAAVATPEGAPMAAAISSAAADLGRQFAHAAGLGRVPLELAAHQLVQRLACLTVATLFVEEADSDAAGGGRGPALAVAHLRRWLPDVAMAAGISTDPWDNHDLRVFAAVVDHPVTPCSAR